MNYVRPLLVLTVLAALVVGVSGCDPKEGGSCKEGSYSTQVDRSGKRTNLSCINGRWRKVP